MIDLVNKNTCVGCTACINICPQNCITMKLDQEGFLYPTIDSEKCIECHSCSSVCPVNIDWEPNADSTSIIGGFNKDIQQLDSSSSGGGVFASGRQIFRR